ncbi:hypothetical protein [Paenibacillus sp. FSL R5-0908]|uniref:hypothetical protein n=1 Tax=Paenibacillus sp. FSL R5-0908 TaxID=2921664 RepID=UPI0030FC74BE
MAATPTRKQVLSLLYVFREAGAAQGVLHTTLDEYLQQLHKAGFLAHELRETAPGVQDTFLVLTEAGENYLKGAGK